MARYWQHVEQRPVHQYQVPEGNQKGSISSCKEEYPGRPEKPARRPAGVTVTAASAEGQSRVEPVHPYRKHVTSKKRVPRQVDPPGTVWVGDPLRQLAAVLLARTLAQRWVCRAI